MAVIYLKHLLHGEKVAASESEAAQDRENGWVDFDPTTPSVPAFLAPVESDLPEDFPGREALVEAGFVTWESVVDLTRDELIAIKGIGPKKADAILDVINS